MAHRFVLFVNYGQLLFETIAHKCLLWIEKKEEEDVN